MLVGDALIPAMEAGVVPPVVSEPEAPSASLKVFGYIIVMTAVLLLLMKYGLFWVIKTLLLLSMLGGAFISLSIFVGYLALPLAVTLVAVFYLRQENIWVVNSVLVFSLAGVGGLIGASLGIKPALILIILLSAYDVVAVFGTKHMVTLAKGARGRLPLMFSIPLRESHLSLGTGDLAMPLVFTVSVLRDYTLTHATYTAAGGLVGVTVLFAYILYRGRATLPALPPITVGLITGYATGLFF